MRRSAKERKGVQRNGNECKEVKRSGKECNKLNKGGMLDKNGEERSGEQFRTRDLIYLLVFMIAFM